MYTQLDIVQLFLIFAGVIGNRQGRRRGQPPRKNRRDRQQKGNKRSLKNPGGPARRLENRRRSARHSPGSPLGGFLRSQVV